MELQSRNLRRGLDGEDVALLHRELIDVGFDIAEEERARTAFGETTHAAVVYVQRERGLGATGVVDAATAGAIDAVRAAMTVTVTGHVSSRTRLSVGELRVSIVDRNLGKEAAVPLAEVTTDNRGAYRAIFAITDIRRRGKRKPDLQSIVRLGERFLAASDVRYNASRHEVIDILLDDAVSAALPSEHETLIAHLAGLYAGDLGDLREGGDRQDITYLANKSGWDARAVALAALARQFSVKSGEGNGDGLAAPWFYALFRAGRPADEHVLYHTDMQTVTAIWKRALVDGVIAGALGASLPDALTKYRQIAAERILDAPDKRHVSWLRQILPVSLGKSPKQQRRFVELYLDYAADREAFWKAVAREFPEKGERLKLDAQLGALTLYNVPLITGLHARHDLAYDADLVALGYYRGDAWLALIGDGAIPAEIPATVRGRPAEYADMLAARVRLRFPTATAAEMIRNGQTPLADGAREEIHAFLTAHQRDYDFATQPIEQYLGKNRLQMSEPALRELKRIQRVYQIAPSDAAMNGLLSEGFDSAYAIVKCDRQAFIETFKDKVGGEAEASLIYAKAEQVHGTVAGIAATYMLARNAPAIGLPSEANPTGFLNAAPAGPTTEGADTSDVIAYPTLEELFGGLDYCDCEDCRSILSPAAYLVDLLRFLEPETTTWEAHLARWKRDHDDAPYPFTSVTAWNDAGRPEPKKPYDVFAERRGDIPHLLLTCENTNLPVPYIDLVNEALAFFIVNRSLKDYQGHNTDGTLTAEELLSIPQFADGDADKAFAELAKQFFPPPVPFSRRLENLRRCFTNFGVSLPQAMEQLRRNDDLDRSDSSSPPAYAWRDILMEELRISREEYRILTDREVSVRQLYGYEPAAAGAAEVPAELSNAKTFARRIGISYEELVDILKTRFINPSSALIPNLDRLGVSFRRLKVLKDDASTGQAWLDLLPQPPPDASFFAGDIRAWVKDEANFAGIMRLIVLRNPAAADDLGDFHLLELRYADPDAAADGLRPIEFVRLLRFVRLWKKLGWTIDQTDKAITALYPDNLAETEERERLDAGFRGLLPRLGILKRLLAALALQVDSDLLPLLACFSPIDTSGADSLYRQMFLNPLVLRKYPAFAGNGTGMFLDPQRTDERTPLAEHGEALRAAFLLTGDEFEQITDALGIDADTQLTLDKISEIFRRGWLARQLQLGVREFLLLTKVSGLDPFVLPQPDSPLPILRLIDTVTALRGGGLTTAQALYLLWNEDVAGTSAPADDASLDLVRRLRAEMTAIEKEFAVVDDPEGVTARARVALVYGGEDSDLFFSLLDNTLTVEAEYEHDGATLGGLIVGAAPGRIVYDAPGRILSFRGVMSEDDRDRLLAVAGVTESFKAAIEELFAAGHATVAEFLARHPELAAHYQAYIHAEGPPEDRRADLLRGILPELANRRKRQQVLRGMDGLVKAENGFTDMLLTNGHVLAGEPRASISGRVFFADTAAGAEGYAEPALVDLSYGSERPLPRDPENPDAPVSGIWAGSLTAPRTGTYVFEVTVDAGAEVALTVGGKDLSPTSEGGGAMRSGKIELSAGWRYAFTLKVEKLRQALVVSWTCDDVALGVVPARQPNGASALDDFVSSEAEGLSAWIHWGGTATGQWGMASDGVPLSYPDKGDGKLPPNGLAPAAPISVIWRGFVEAPEDGGYRFRIMTDAETVVTLSIAGEPILSGLTRETEAPVDLRSGKLYSITIRADGLDTRADRSAGQFIVLWHVKGRGWQVVPPQFLYPETTIQRVRATNTRFQKAVALAAGLKLTAGEMAYLATLAALDIGEQGWLNSLGSGPAGGDEPSPARTEHVSRLLFAVLTSLLDFVRVKAGVKPDEERLLAVLRDPVAAGAAADGPLYALTGWDAASLEVLLKHFGKAMADLAHLATFRRLSDAFDLLKKTRVPVSVLIATTHNATLDDDGGELRDADEFLIALRARYSPSDWLKLLKTINDETRSAQRDAMVAYILHRLTSDEATRHIDTPDKLFELLLMDVQMDSCMQTSRIRHALSSVQLFIQRCLMNLEKQVAPVVFDAKHWEWMKRYRVWEANRKVFLYPENWLEPELRDDASPIYKEVMSDLLQGDITEDRAAMTLLNYLSKLEEVAKLEPAGMFYVDNELGKQSDDIVHVVGRTTGANRKYFYRRRDGVSWGPWEHIPLEIEDNPVVPVVWQGRLFLVWLTIVQRVEFDEFISDQHLADFTTPINLPREKLAISAILCWSEYYNGKWQSPKTSDVANPVYLYTTGAGQPFIRSALRLWVQTVEGRLRVNILTLDRQDAIATFELHNTHSTPQHLAPLDTAEFTRRELVSSKSQLLAKYQKENGEWEARYALETSMSDRTVSPANPPDDWRIAPFFYEDARNTFYVTTDILEVSLPPPIPPDLRAQTSILAQADAYSPLLEDARRRDALPPVPAAAGTAIRFGDTWIGRYGAMDGADRKGKSHGV